MQINRPVEIIMIQPGGFYKYLFIYEYVTVKQCDFIPNFNKSCRNA